jgi:hypothetical protein
MRSAVIVLAGVSLVSAGLPAAAQSITHGATVTVEQGVRVIRPLPRVKEQVSPGSGQPDVCPCKPAYLHRIGEAAGSGRYIRRVGETQPLSGPR